MPAVTLAEFKEHLNLSATTSESDNELQRHLNAAIEVIEDRIGPILHTTITERVTANGGAVVISTKPLVSVTTLAMVNGLTYDVNDLDLGEDSGVIRHILEIPFPRGRYDVEYVAGHDETDASDKRKMAVLYVAEHFWDMQRKGNSDRPGLFGEETDSGEGSVSEAAAKYIYKGYALPRRALELISFDEQDDGFA